jgi:hypothetical protein
LKIKLCNLKGKTYKIVELDEILKIGRGGYNFSFSKKKSEEEG